MTVSDFLSKSKECRSTSIEVSRGEIRKGSNSAASEAPQRGRIFGGDFFSGRQSRMHRGGTAPLQGDQLPTSCTRERAAILEKRKRRGDVRKTKWRRLRRRFGIERGPRRLFAFSPFTPPHPAWSWLPTPLSGPLRAPRPPPGIPFR